MSPRATPPRRPLAVPRMRLRADRQAAPPDAADEAAAGERLRVEAARRFALRVAAALVAAATLAIGVAAARARLLDAPLAPEAAAGLALAAWLAMAGWAWRSMRSDVVDDGHLRAATVVRCRDRQVVARECRGDVWSWRYRTVPGARQLRQGERVWLTGRGEPDEAPHLVAAEPLARGRHVAWAAREQPLRRVPDPQADHDSSSLPVIDPDDPIS